MTLVKHIRFQPPLGLFGLTASLLAGFSAINSDTNAQTLVACPPPRANEYLLLVPNPQADTQARLQQLLPANAVLTPCNYLNTTVVRVEGFANVDIATAWAQYLSDTANLQAFVASPAPASSIAAVPTPNAGGTSSPVAAATVPTFNPQPLGTGYAVLVKFQNQPELATNVRQVTNQNVGLVSYEQQPYLLAALTADPAFASSVLKALSDRGLVASIVDSRRAVLLTPAVKLGSN
jgi:hypothetical protein